MPRGNDKEAHEEFAGQYGDFQNAEELIAAHRASIEPEVMAAGLKAIDPAATADLDLDSIETWEKGDTVLSASVRGDKIVFVAESEEGLTYKSVVDYKPGSKAAGGAKTKSGTRSRSSRSRSSRSKGAAQQKEDAESEAAAQGTGPKQREPGDEADKK